MVELWRGKRDYRQASPKKPSDRGKKRETRLSSKTAMVLRGGRVKIG